MISPLKLQKQVDIFIKHPDTVICGARARTWNEDKKEFTVTTPAFDKDISCMTAEQFFYLGDWVKSCTRMVTRELMLSIPLNYSRDYRQVHYLLAKNPSGSFRCLDEVVAVYREHAGGAFSGADSVDLLENNFESTRLIAKLFSDERAVAMRESAIEIAKRLLLTESLGIKKHANYAFLFWGLSLYHHFSFSGIKRHALGALTHLSNYLSMYPACKSFLRPFYDF